MNELQQVLLIFAVVVIAGLYFLSRSRQNAIKKNSKSHSHTHQDKVEANSHSSAVSTQDKDHNQQSNHHSEKAAEALKNLGNPHIPLSDATEKRITQSKGFSNTELKHEAVQQQTVHAPLSTYHLEAETDINHNQGVLSFGEEFDLPPQTTSVVESEQTAASSEMPNEVTTVSGQPIVGSTDENSNPTGGKHHVLVVDDPGMTGEIDENAVPADYVKPSFGIPEEELKTKKKMASTNKEPEVYVIMVLTTGQEFPMRAVNQALLGVGLTYSDQAIFVKNDNMGNPFIKVANMLEPGTFPVENLDAYATPGVALILELPTTVRAPAAMHDLIIMARKISQRLNGRLYNMERHLIKESDLQSMRDAALDYESEPIA
ncbi:hypothetical protein THMIRHAM_11790 [Thiomicrorhabdus immobilis]|uniref:Cell division protein ZipA n=1 Tax=Thiomicrorhabdus immobilis TaxID=2791037 RepID=A0ABN6D0E2_9GAMM|nr:cell division protein ZipA C-terminal FtsZ-binding domain-containing protein [Thiomicrorhabdus immobilis]BCN93394.1 hypothetical protein THMIRHAM_11790 [Thiomicrorhabdus immobilis]